MPAWAAVGLFILPTGLVLLIQWGEAPPRLVAAVHLAAASMMLLFGGGIEVGAWLGYRPEGTGLYRAMAHAGWTFAWSGILRRARRHRRRGGETE